MKAGNIIVRTGRDKGSRAEIGKIYMTTSGYSWSPNSAYVGAGWEVKKEHYRKATKEEIEAFYNGIKNIKDIKPKCYEIY